MLIPTELSHFKKCTCKEISSASFLHIANKSNELFLSIIVDVHISLVTSKLNYNLIVLKLNLCHELYSVESRTLILTCSALSKNVLLNH